MDNLVKEALARVNVKIAAIDGALKPEHKHRLTASAINAVDSLKFALKCMD
ncbi:unnamed protein product [marine sediment metagenome]|uniref:Uncharacterized protein n=1 Tax=marine sediment metagenome TaxID=412755 RepID=X1J4W3_9ZZZZ